MMTEQKGRRVGELTGLGPAQAEEKPGWPKNLQKDEQIIIFRHTDNNVWRFIQGLKDVPMLKFEEGGNIYGMIRGGDLDDIRKVATSCKLYLMTYRDARDKYAYPDLKATSNTHVVLADELEDTSDESDIIIPDEFATMLTKFTEDHEVIKFLHGCT